jgi:hypothetical protein
MEWDDMWWSKSSSNGCHGRDYVLHKLHLVMCLCGNYANGNHGGDGGGRVLKFEIVISDIWQQVRGNESVEIANFHFKYFLNDGNINRVLKIRWWEYI